MEKLKQKEKIIKKKNDLKFEGLLNNLRIKEKIIKKNEEEIEKLKKNEKNKNFEIEEELILEEKNIFCKNKNFESERI